MCEYVFKKGGTGRGDVGKGQMRPGHCQKAKQRYDDHPHYTPPSSFHLACGDVDGNSDAVT